MKDEKTSNREEVCIYANATIWRTTIIIGKHHWRKCLGNESIPAKSMVLNTTTTEVKKIKEIK
jgi:hypothetical protein